MIHFFTEPNSAQARLGLPGAHPAPLLRYAGRPGHSLRSLLGHATGPGAGYSAPPFAGALLYRFFPKLHRRNFCASPSLHIFRKPDDNKTGITE